MTDSYDKKILVIGNGFDIFHGYKTRYKDFVDYTRSIKSQDRDNPYIKYFQVMLDGSSDSEEKKWIDCEQEIAQVVKSFSKITKRLSALKANNIKAEEIGRDLKDKVVYNHFKEILESNQNGVVVDKKYKTIFGYYDKYQLIEELKNELEKVIRLLQSYLIKACEDKNIHMFSNLPFDHIVNFNYTKTYQNYKFEDSNVTNIHGTIDDSPNNMVLGIKDELSADLDYLYFKKYFQRIQKHNDHFDVKTFCTGAISLKPLRVAAHFYGHSMSDTDGDIIGEILDTVTHNYVYYYNQRDYEEKVANIIEMIGKDRFLQYFHEGKIRFEETDEFVKFTNEINGS